LSLFPHLKFFAKSLKTVAQGDTPQLNHAYLDLQGCQDLT
jgi:hypothetical protein